MAASPAQAALDAIRRPLVFAARDDFAALDRVRDLERSVQQSCRRALPLSIPPDLRDLLRSIESSFSSPLEREALRGVVAKALERLEPWCRPGLSDRLLGRSASVLPGVGPKRAQTLEARGLGRVVDLLFHLPVRYDDRRSLERVGDLVVGRRATFIAEIQSVSSSHVRGRGRFRRLLHAVAGDETGSVSLKWFRGAESIESTVAKGSRLLVTGDVRRYRFSKELVHPEIERLEDDPAAEASGLRRIVPDYATPEGLPPRTLRGLIARALEQYADVLEGALPEALVRERKLPEPAAALRAVHAPDPEALVESYRSFASSAHERLVLEELYLLELGLALRRARQAQLSAQALSVGDSSLRRAVDELPFRLTAAQRRSWGEIRADLARPHPMNRLLQGDVGSGKTVVAYLAACATAAAGCQTALMAPTELLAEQHARTLRRLVAPAGSRGGAGVLRIALLTASVPRPQAELVRAGLAAGEIDLVVGTHSLVQEEVRFARLALAIVDEQHRFGVLQRAALAAKAPGGLHPHNLVMTATPIPRTLALTLYGDLDLSVIDELPPGRLPVETLLIRQGEGRRVLDLLQSTVARGEQAYIVYPLVEESEKLDLRNASDSAERIRRALPGRRVDLVHGRLDSGARGEAMARFEAGKTDVLVSTTVIEVGVDVANATLMVVEHAERFGLAQLHQLRGRVGRGVRPGTCVLVARGVTEHAEARLAAMLRTSDGFEIADADLRIRGPGEFLGTRQHGTLPDLRVADLLRDSRWISVAREAAIEQIRGDPGLARAPDARRAVEARWGARLALARVG